MSPRLQRAPGVTIGDVNVQPVAGWNHEMTRIAIAGAAHPHVAYATAEVDAVESLELVAVADPSRETAERWAAPYDAKVFPDHQELLREVEPDIVMVAGIYGDRGRAVVDALNALGAHRDLGGAVTRRPLAVTGERIWS